jgi:hypothetical protein
VSEKDQRPQPCAAGAHNPLRIEDGGEVPKSFCSKCGRFIEFIDRVWIIDTEKEPPELKQ